MRWCRHGRTDLPDHRADWRLLHPSRALSMSRDKRSGSLWSLRCAINACFGAVAFIALCPALTDTSAVAQKQKPAGCDSLPDRKKFDTTPPINIGLLADELIYHRCTDYDADVAKTLAQA